LDVGDDVGEAVRQIWWSANSDSAITYRQRVGLFSQPNVGVVVQTLLDPDVAGVMFTQNPINQADERLIEASWGLGAVEDDALDEIGSAGKGKIGGQVQLNVRVKPASKARQGRNPATGEEITISANPASVVLRPRALTKAKGALPSVAALGMGFGHWVTSLPPCRYVGF